MTCQLRLRPQVESDIEETALWYEERQARLGEAFVHEVRQAINSLKSNPLLYPVRHRRYPIRWMFPKRFPYRIVFVVKEEIVTILCVTHAKRRRPVWKGRLREPSE
jgi:toxin ParE1/3/4